ncbi:hypothetical protein C0V77_10105 [Emticicia sp. TH156]|nr:hypothetical protein C0V77_10105 [Emticicia sp. TH156]
MVICQSENTAITDRKAAFQKKSIYNASYFLALKPAKLDIILTRSAFKMTTQIDLQLALIKDG